MVSSAVWLPPLKYQKKKQTQTQTSHIRQMAVVHAQINLHMYSSADNSQRVRSEICWAGWKPLKQQLCLAKIGITDLLISFFNCCKIFDRYVFIINPLTFLLNLLAIM